MYFPSTVTLYPFVSEDGHHKMTYGTSSTPSCRYAKKDQILKDKAGKDVLTVGWVQFPLGTPCSKNDKIVFPDGTTGPIVQASRTIHYPHTGAEMCIEVYVGKESI